MNNNNLEGKAAQNTGFWLSRGLIWGPIKSGKFGLNGELKIIGVGIDMGYTVSKSGKILDPQKKETGYFFDSSLNILGPEYGTLPWMIEKAKPGDSEKETPADYGMEIDEHIPI